MTKWRIQKGLAWLLSLFLLIGTIPVGLASDNFTKGSLGGSLTWMLSDGVLTIEGKGAMENFQDPFEVPWYPHMESIQCVVVKKGVTSIGNYAFYDYEQLSEVNFPEGLTSIGDFAFSGCETLAELKFSSGLNTIGERAFYGCSSLSELILPEGLTAIGPNAFRACRGLAGVQLPDSLVTIGASAFESCSGLTKINIPAGVSEIGDRAFNCLKLAKFTVSNQNRHFCVADNVLFTSDKRTLVAYPCDKPGESYAIPDGVVKVAGSAFWSTALTELTVPASVTSVGERAFGNNRQMTNITVAEENPNYSSLNGVFLSKDGSVLITYPAGKSSLTFPDSVTKIEAYAFYNCAKLTSMNIPNRVTEIGEYAFYACSRIQEAHIPNALAEIPNDLFGGCGSLVHVELPKSVVKIGKYAFNGCGRLISMVWPAGLASVDYYAFRGCDSLSHVYYRGTEETLNQIAIKQSGNRILTQVEISLIGTGEAPAAAAPLNPAMSEPVSLETKDLTGRFPVELGSIPVKELLGEAIYDECISAFGQNAVVQAAEDEDYKNVAGGLNGSVDLREAYWAHYTSETGELSVKLKVGTDLMTAGCYYTYHVNVKTLRLDDIMRFTVLVKPSGADKAKEVRTSKPYAIGMLAPDTEGNQIGVFYPVILDASTADFPRNSSVGLRLDFAEGFDQTGAAWAVYGDLYGSLDPTLDPPVEKLEDYTDIFAKGVGLTYQDREEGWRARLGDFTIAVSRGGVTQMFPVSGLQVHSKTKTIYPRLYANSGLSYVGVLTDKEQDGDVEVRSITLPADSDYIANAAYWMRLRFADSLSEDASDMGIDLIRAAYVGKFSNEADAAAHNAEDIKEILFSKTSVINPNRGGYRANFSGEGVTFTVIDTDGEVHYYRFVVKDQQSPNSNGEQSLLAADTSFDIVGAYQGSQKNQQYISDVFVNDFSNDAYYHNGYQTIFFLDKNKEGLSKGSVITPIFQCGETVSIYAGENNTVGQKVSGQRQTSGKSTVTLDGPVTTVQYSAAAENGLCLKNYWVSYVTQNPGGAQLFVNGASNAIDAHKTSAGEPRRVVVLDAAHGYHHDLTVVNIGDQPLTGLKVTLSKDAKGVALEEFWQTGEHTLAAFNAVGDSYTIDYQPSAARIRLVRAVDGNGNYQEGEVSGTLTISSDNGGSVTMELSGISGDLALTTETMRNGVQYVPYDQAVQNSSTAAASAIRYEVEGELPEGLELYGNGVIYGMPVKVGKSTFKLTATLNANRTGLPDETIEREYTIEILENSDENVWGETDVSSSQAEDYSLTIAIPNQDGTTNNINVGGGSAVIGSNSWSESTLTMKSQGSFSNFKALYLDGKLLSQDDYSTKEGSTVITISTQTLSDCAEGRHTLAAEFYEKTPSDGTLRRSAQNYTLNIRTGGNSGPDNSGSSVTPTPSAPTPAPAPTLDEFDDVLQNVWYAEYIHWAYENSFMSGYGMKQFGPDDAASPAMIAAALARLLGADLSAYTDDAATNEWYSASVAWAGAQGLFQDVDPSAPVSRGEFAIMAVRFLRNQSIDCVLPEQPQQFVDADTMSAVEKEAFQILYELRVFNGVDGGYMDARGVVTRAQLSALLYRLAQIVRPAQDG